jgi:hypothetical protein
MARPPSSFPPTSPDSTLKVSLIVGSFVHKSLTADLFDLIVPASQPVVPHPEEVHYHPQPAIVHTFRPAQKTPPAFISAVFSVLVLGPWIVLFGMVCPFHRSTRALADVHVLRSGRIFLQKFPTCSPQKSSRSPLHWEPSKLCCSGTGST